MRQLSLILMVGFSLWANAKVREPYLKAKNLYAVPQSYLDAVLTNLNGVLQSARAVPYRTKAGAFAGFEIEAIEAKSDLRKLGLLAGDILLQINDTVLDAPGKGLEAFQTISLSKTVKLHLLRKKKRLVLSYEKVA